jgi:hypothetical protein
MKTEIIKLGTIGVDSGMLMICDPVYIDTEYEQIESDEGGIDHAHEIYRHKEDGRLWQYTYGQKPTIDGVIPFPGTYADKIPDYGMCPNNLKAKGLFESTDLDPTPHIQDGDFSYRGMCKASNGKYGGQVGHISEYEDISDSIGAAIVFKAGFGDGVYDVFAEVIDLGGHFGKRVKKVWVELITDSEIQFIEETGLSKKN